MHAINVSVTQPFPTRCRVCKQASRNGVPHPRKRSYVQHEDIIFKWLFAGREESGGMLPRNNVGGACSVWGVFHAIE